MGNLRLTLKVTDEVRRPKYPYGGSEWVQETETLCDVQDQHLSPGMLAAALRQLADEIHPPKAAF